jgi:hypothetical protein
LKGSLTQILRRRADKFTCHPKDGVLRIFIALTNPSFQPDLNPRTLGPVASMLAITPPTATDLLIKLPDYFSAVLFLMMKFSEYFRTFLHF